VLVNDDIQLGLRLRLKCWKLRQTNLPVPDGSNFSTDEEDDLLSSTVNFLELDLRCYVCERVAPSGL
jgi:hypothetical protein